MGLENELNTRLVSAMREKRTKEISLIRMIKTKAGEVRTASGFNGEINDAFWLDVIKKFVKQQTKALAEFEKLGDRGAEHVTDIKFELEYLAPFLPRQRGEDDVRNLVKQAIAETGAADTRMVGKVIGFVMKDHKDEVDASMVKRIAAELLG